MLTVIHVIVAIVLLILNHAFCLAIESALEMQYRSLVAVISCPQAQGDTKRNYDDDKNCKGAPPAYELTAFCGWPVDLLGRAFLPVWRMPTVPNGSVKQAKWCEPNQRDYGNNDHAPGNHGEKDKKKGTDGDRKTDDAHQKPD